VLLLWTGMGLALEVRLVQDRLTVKAGRAPLQDILRELARMGIAVRCDPAINPLVDADFTNREIRGALEDILKPYASALIWETVQGPAGPAQKLAEIQVFQAGRRDRLQSLRASRTIVAGSARGPFWVKGEILLRLKPGADNRALRKLLGRIGATVIDANADMGVYRLRVPDDTDVAALCRQLSQGGLVDQAEPHFAFPLLPSYRADSTMGLSAEPAASAGSGPAVAVFDTGAATAPGILGFNALDPSQSAADTHGHGTRMALLASGRTSPLGAAPDPRGQAPVLAVKTMDDNGFTSSFDLMRAIDFAEANGARVLSLSWGSATPSAFLEQALGQAASQGMVIVAAAGNEPSGQPVYPAAYPFVIGVGALAPDGTRWDRSNFGDFVALYAPGWASIADDGAVLYAGTSVATAFIANQAARYLADHPGAGSEEVTSWLKKVWGGGR